MGLKSMAGHIAVGAGAAGALAFCALALSDAVFVMATITDPIKFLGIPAMLGAIAGGGAFVARGKS